MNTFYYHPSFSFVGDYTVYIWFCTNLYILNGDEIIEIDSDYELHSIFSVSENTLIVVTELSVSWRSTSNWGLLYEYVHDEVIMSYSINDMNSVSFEDFNNKKFIINKDAGIVVL